METILVKNSDNFGQNGDLLSQSGDTHCTDQNNDMYWSKGRQILVILEDCCHSDKYGKVLVRTARDPKC